ncbi:MAG: small ribosomal subunit biogenesis GTPase RsgA [Leptolyngbyaceae cyanobacterium MO_188.B28]|nr:small ribosomal subunit biogenesis GTPase RsgA [Leptolyngbyaceae cyanobacterium MO_188.B28]
MGKVDPLQSSERKPLEESEDQWGTVLAAQANFYWVRLDSHFPLAEKNFLTQDNLSNGSLLCTRRARLKKMGQQVIVGDRVRVETPDGVGERGAIAEVLPRQTLLDRPPVANANQILLVFALAEPTPDPYQLSRFLVKAESTRLPVCLCLNKQDLVSQAIQTQWRDRLTTWGYPPLLISAKEHRCLDQLTSQLQGRTTVVCGPSGVGKSSLINQLAPGLNLRVGKVSGKLGRGRHTTRHIELFELPTGGFLADTPGFNQPDITCSPDALGHYFPEIRQCLTTQQCQFSNCLHRDEPGCQIRGDWPRYDYYLTMLEAAIAQQQVLNHQPDSESTVKVKIAESGKRQQEPKLQAKKYRRLSRRSQNQALQNFCNELTDTNDAQLLSELDDFL